ncbi:DUF4912 domain-containing protein [Methylocucumis oryzae]|uniref:DUF4912 domain-containing protein n=1 Tax=Methylocucumis oryzae TaxID=1632867 RepID=UPI0005F35705|nr:DUF4912 domain-containing protein [Methylocucumis oryzae]
MKKFSRFGYDTQITLSSEELFEISQEIAFNYSPKRIGLFSSFDEHKTLSNQNKIPNKTFSSQYSNTRLTMQEILNINQEVRLNYTPDADESLPDVLLLPVDPFHIYAYWSVMTTQAPQAHPLHLRVYWHPDGTLTTAKHIWFDIPLNTEKNRQQLRVPLSGEYYSAAVGSLDANAHFIQLAHSNTVQVPHIKPVSNESFIDDSRPVDEKVYDECIMINYLPLTDSHERNVQLFLSALAQFKSVNDDGIYAVPPITSSYKSNSLASALIR